MSRAAPGGRRRVVSVTGSRADYGLMQPVHRALAASGAFELHLIVTGMHFLPAFAASLAEVRADRLGTLHELALPAAGDGGRAMGEAIGHGLIGAAALLERLAPDLVLLQGDRGEMLAAAVAAAHLNLPVVHMSGGDRSGSVDDAVRNAISKLAHFHLASCADSARRLAEMGEPRSRIAEVGDPALDRIRTLDAVPLAELQAELDLPRGKPFLLATLHPVTDEAGEAGAQMRLVIEALAASGLTAVFTHPNNDAGGEAMREALEASASLPFLRVRATLGSRRYLSLMRHAAALVGNSSSGIIEAASFGLPVVNIGPRQSGRLRAGNVIDVPFERQALAGALRAALDPEFRRRLADCRNPYGDGHAAERTVDILRRLRLGPALTAKWREGGASLLDA